MPTFFFDTNALVKYYTFDATSYRTISIISRKQPRHRIVVSEIVRIEIPSALYKIARITTSIDAGETDLAIRRFRHSLIAHRSPCAAATCYNTRRLTAQPIATDWVGKRPVVDLSLL